MLCKSGNGTKFGSYVRQVLLRICAEVVCLHSKCNQVIIVKGTLNTVGYDRTNVTGSGTSFIIASVRYSIH